MPRRHCQFESWLLESRVLLVNVRGHTRADLSYAETDRLTRQE
jgi:hypothetical protein